MHSGILKVILPSILLLICCSDGQDTQSKNQNKPIFVPTDCKRTHVCFNNEIVETEAFNSKYYDYYYNGAGVGVGDLDNDGLNDLVFASNMFENKLYRNTGNLVFEDISESLLTGKKQIKGWSTGVNLVDINQDGLLDIYICQAGPAIFESRKNQLFINQGNFSFIESADSYGLADNGFSTQSCFFDFDKDGDLDAIIINHASFYYPSIDKFIQSLDDLTPEQYRNNTFRFYENNDGYYRDITEEKNLNFPSYALGIIAADFNNDSFTDIYVANDFFIPDLLLINDKEKGFNNEINKYVKHTPYYSMGVDAGDINNDGLIDISLLDMTPEDHKRSKITMPSMRPQHFNDMKYKRGYVDQYMFNSLQLNNGQNVFSDIGQITSTAKTGWSWSTLLADFDNDSNKDLFITNGFRRDTRNNDWMNALVDLQLFDYSEKSLSTYYNHLLKADETPEQNYLFKNDGDLKFTNMSAEWGLKELSFSNGAAYADLDNDGDLDLIVNNIDKKTAIWENKSNEVSNNHYITIIPKDNNGNSSLNAKIKVHLSDKVLYHETTNVRGYMSSMVPKAHFGLGQSDEVLKIEIQWSNGVKNTILKPRIDTTYIIKEQKSKRSQTTRQHNSLFKMLDAVETGLTFRHQENIYDDFKQEILLPHSQSKLGPFVSVGDLNNDGLDDIFIGGAKNQSSEIYKQSADYRFEKIESPLLTSFKQYEDMGSQLIDIDGDNDLDIYVCSGGGADMTEDRALLQDRLYINKGNFEFTAGRIPKNLISSGRVIAHDIDFDGDEDLLVCGRTNPGNYPNATKTTILIKESNQLIDRTNTILPELNNIGMVTDALFTDLDGDNIDELIVVGEWMSIHVFQNKGQQYKDVSEHYGVSNLKGWWYSCTSGDFDNDGDIDLLVGNIGLNNKHKASYEKPLRLYFNDFDDNGQDDIVLAFDYEGKYVPSRGKQCSSEQMPFLTEKYPTYSSFADADIQSLFDQNKLEEAQLFEATTFSSIILENTGKGFEVIQLPYLAQLSAVNAITQDDLNDDGLTDFILGGNYYSTEPETPSYDASNGIVLLSKSPFEYEALMANDSGLNVPGDVKDIKQLTLGDNRKLLVVTNNNETAQLVEFN